MKSLGLFSQIVTVILAVLIAMFYVQPTVAEIGQIQTDTNEFFAERQKIANINAELRSNVALVQSVAPANKAKLATYMPPFVDDISVLRDIGYIANQAGVVYNELSYEGPGALEDASPADVEVTSALGDLAPTPHSFLISVSGRYEQIKNFLALIEQNEYPLEVHSFTLSVDDSEIQTMSAEMTLVTYADDAGALVIN